jgi:hypothetical protein
MRQGLRFDAAQVKKMLLGMGAKADAAAMARAREVIENGPVFSELMRKDAAENVFFLLQTEFIKQRTYDKKYPALYGRSFLPVDNEVDRAATTVRIRSYTKTGIGKLLGSYADDLPRSDVKADEMTVQVKGWGSSYGYGLDEIRAAARANVALDQKKAEAARRAWEALVDRILAEGDTNTGMLGLFNQPNAQTYVIPPGGGGSTLWANKTPEEILQDMVGIVEKVITTTFEAEHPNIIVMPRPQFVQISTQRFNNLTQTTILGWFEKAYPGVMVKPWYKALGKGVGGADRMVAYVLDPDHLQAIIPQEFEQLPIQERGLEFLTPCHGRIGGVVMYYPLSMAYGDGI